MRLKFRFILFILCIVSGLLVTGTCFAQVTAKFTSSPASGCAPLFVSFNNTSTGSGTLTYTWDFGNGNTSNLQEPSQTYNSCGNYVVTLTVSNGAATSADTAHITVYCKPTATFIPSNTNGCPGTCVNFTNTSTAGSGTLIQTSWDFGDGNTSLAVNPTHCYLSPGNFNVTLTVTNSVGCTNSTVIANAITIYKPPVANFSGIVTTQCTAPATINFTNSSSGTGNLTYNWNFGDPASGGSNTSILATPGHTYNSSGTYTVTLIVIDGNGCTDTLSLPNYINIGSLSDSITSLPSNTGCCPFVVNFGEISSGTPTGYNWNFGGGIPNSTVQNPQITFPCPAGINPEVYTVTLTETYSGGCTAIATTTITVNSKPIADFNSGSTLSTCITPNVVVFNNTSTVGAGSKFEWFFGDGDTSSAINPSHSYTSCGTYNVMLIATNQYGCSDTMQKPAFVTITCPVADYIALPQQGCVPKTVNFLSTTSTGNPIQWSWDFGDPGSGAADSSTLQNPSHTYTNPGCYTIILETTNALGCKARGGNKDAVCLDQPPTANFSASPTTTCAKFNVNFTNLSTGTDSLTTYLWEFGDGNTSSATNPSHVYNDTGYFSVTLVVCNAGCCDSITFSNYIHILPPIAVMNVTLNCSNPYNICFDGSLSIGASTYNWNFGDPGSGAFDSSNSVAPCHLYSGSGIDTVSLTVYNSVTGCSFTQTNTIQVRDVKAAFSILHAAGCQPLNVVTVNKSADANSYQWIVTDSATKAILFTSALVAPAFTFTTSGTYLFKLTATGANECTDTLSSSIRLDSSLVNFIGTPLSGCAPLISQFTDISTSSGDPLVSWSWNFGDSVDAATQDTSSLKTPQHTYTKSGSYTVQLTVTDSLGCSQTSSHVNYVIVQTPATNFNASDTNACAGSQICFTSLTNDSGYTYSWNFGDAASGVNDSSNLADPCHTYNLTGVYTVSLKATSPGGCDSVLIKSNYIRISSPVANFGVAGNTSSICPPLIVNFADSSQSNITSWQWNFGDGNTSTDENPSHVYSISGSYTVTLIVTNTTGCTDTIIKTNYIVVQGPNGTFSFTPDHGCAPLDVCFKANATANLTYIWNYGNTTSGPLPNGDSICYYYTIPGVYHPSLIMQDSAGCVFSLNSPDSVLVEGSNAKFGIDNNPKCGPGPIQFIDSTYSLSAISSWNWNFGDPISGASDTSSLQNPSHNYSTVGKYGVILSVTTVDGCSSMYEDTLTILGPPVALIDVLNNPICPGGVISFRDSSSSVHPIVSWLWNFGDSASGASDTSALQNTSHQYNSPGNYNVKLIIVDQLGCTDSTTNMVTVVTNPTVTATTPAPICNGASTILSANAAATYTWTPATALTTTTGSSVTANPSTTTTYTITGSDGIGCSATTTVIVTVNPNPTLNIPTPSPFCNGDSTTLAVNGAISYTWSPATGLNTTTGSSVTANPSASTPYLITGINGSGCSATTTVMVAVVPNPTITVTPISPICIGSNTIVTATGAAAYTWAPATGLTATTGLSVTANPTTTTTYTITGTNVGGCSATTTIEVAVVPDPTITVAAPSPICSGSSTTVTANGATSYIWTPSTGLNAITGSSVTANPTATTTYTITGTNVSGCSSTTTVNVLVNPDPILNVTTPSPMCDGSSASLIAAGAVSYTWSPAIGLNTTAGSSIIASPATTTSYTISGTDNNGCVSTASVNVAIYPLPSITVPPPTPYCQGDSTILTATGGLTYTWSPSNALSATTGSSVLAKPANTQQYTVTGTDANGCVGNANVLLVVNPNPVISTNTPTDLCSGKSEKLIAHGAATYSWGPAIGLNTTFGSSVTASPTNTITYTVVGIDDNGCSGSTPVQVAVIQIPSVSIFGLNSSYCMNNTPVTLSGTPPGGTFYGDGVDSGQFIPALAGEGTFTINYVYTNSNGCIGSTNTTVTVAPVPKVIINPANPTICSGNPINLSVTGALSYIWSPVTGLSDSTGSSVTVDATITTTYIIEGINNNGCADTTMATVYFDTIPQVSFNAQPSDFCSPLVMQFNNTSKWGYSYNWDFGDGFGSSNLNPLHTYNQPGIYKVGLIVTSPHGCIDDTAKYVVIKANDNDEVMLGNAFTPDGDGINDIIAPNIMCQNLSGYVFRIYSRWGQVVFNSNDPSKGWDGKYNGQLEPVGVYDYYIEFSCGDCKIVKKGNITLLK